MCISPLRIRNPNKGASRDPSRGINFLKDTVSTYINVPCGVCPECVMMRQMNIVQRLNVEYKFNLLFFCTLTYNNDCLPVHTCSNGRKIPYADISDLQNMFKRLKKGNLLTRPFRYFAVSEFGGEKHRPHFHVMFILPRLPEDDDISIWNLEQFMFKTVLGEWKRNTAKRVLQKDSKNGKRKMGDLVPDNVHPVFVPLCTYVRKVYRNGTVKTNYELEFVRPRSIFQNEDCVSFYISKYMLKPNVYTRRLQQALHLNLPSDEYEEVWHKVRPKSLVSQGLGLASQWNEDEHKFIALPEAKDFVRQCVQLSKVSYNSPRYFAPSGATYPLSRYYYKFGDIFSVQDAIDFYEKSDRKDNDGVSFDETSYTHRVVTPQKFQDRLSLIDSHEKLDSYE